MTPLQMLTNLIISFAIACLGLWLKSYDSILAKAGGWVLAVFGILGVVHAAKWFIGVWRGSRLQMFDPEFADAIDRAIHQGAISEEDENIISSRVQKPKSFQSSGASWEDLQEDWKAEVDRLCKTHPEKKMKETFAMASEYVKKKHPQFDAKNQ